MTFRRYPRRNMRNHRTPRDGYVHEKPGAITPDNVSISPASQTLPAGTESVTLQITRSGKFTFPASVRWTTSIGTTGVVEWDTGDPATIEITLGVFAQTNVSPSFAVTLSDPFNLNIVNGVAVVQIASEVLTSQPYPVTEENNLQPSMALVRLGSVQWPTDSVTSNGQVVAITTSVAWTPLDVDYIQDGQTATEFYESLTGEGEVIGIRVNSIFEPLDVDYIQAGQTSVEFHEDLTGEGEVIGITVASIYEPVDVNYKQAGQNDSDFVEALISNGEVTGIRTVNTL